MLDGGRLPCDEGAVRAAPATEACSPGVRRWILATVILGSGLTFLLGSALNVALPAIQASLEATVAEMQWVANAYTLPLAALLLAGGEAGDRYGRRRVFVAGMAVIAAAALLCAAARGPTELSLWQATLGLGAALTVPTGLALLSAFFPREERGRAVGTWAAFTAVSGALGPVLGGWLVDTASWRWIFAAVVPGAAAAAVLCLRFVPENRAPGGGARPDWPGALLAAAGLAAVTWGLVGASGDRAGHWTVPAALVAGVLLLAAFAAVERRPRGRSPMLTPGLFRSRTFAGANGLTLLLYFALGGAFFFLPFNLIQVQGYSATGAGAAFLPFTVVMGGLSRWSGGLLDRHGARLPLTVGPVLAAGGVALLAVPGVGGSYWSTFFPALLVLGLGMAVAVAPLTTVVLNAVPDHHAGVASGVNNTASRVGWLMAVAALGLVLQGVFAGELGDRLPAGGLSEEGREVAAAARRELAGVELPAGLASRERRVLERAVDEAFVGSFRVVMGLAALAALLGAAVAWRTVEGREGDGRAGVPRRAIRPDAGRSTAP